jgi:hypothetical protein
MDACFRRKVAWLAIPKVHREWLQIYIKHLMQQLAASS